MSLLDISTNLCKGPEIREHADNDLWCCNLKVFELAKEWHGPKISTCSKFPKEIVSTRTLTDSGGWGFMYLLRLRRSATVRAIMRFLSQAVKIET